MQTPQHNKKSVPLSGWDVAYAIRFEEVNRAIAQQRQVPTRLVCQSKPLVKSATIRFSTQLEVEADYAAWLVVGSHSGEYLGVLVKLRHLRCHLKWLRAPQGSKPAQVLDEQEYHWQHDVGVRLSLQLEWQEVLDKPGRYELRVAKDLAKLSATTDHFIAHPAEEFDINVADDGALIRQLVGRAIAEDARQQFAHVFATIDYTAIAAQQASWLTLQKDCFSYSISTQHAPEPLLPSLPLRPQQPDPADEQDPAYAAQKATYQVLEAAYQAAAVPRYELALDPQRGYGAGTLIIVGMTADAPLVPDEKHPGKSKRYTPGSLPSELHTLIPEGCNAGYAYNDSLLIEHLLKGHLPELFDCTLADFSYTDERRRTLHNHRALTFRHQTELDYSSVSNTPTVRGRIAARGITIAVEDGFIRYRIVSAFDVPKGHLGFGLPQPVEIEQTVEMTFNYLVHPTDKYAQLTLVEMPTIAATLNAKEEEHGSGFGAWAAAFGLSLAENLVMMGLTMGVAMGSSALLRYGYRSCKASTKTKGVVQEIAVAESEAAALVEKKVLEIEEIKQTEALVTKESEASIKAAKETGVIKSSQSGVAVMLELGNFVFWQTLLAKAHQSYQQFTVRELDKYAKKRVFFDFISTGIGVISWGNQPAGSVFEVVEGELMMGAFRLGLHLHFAGEPAAPALAPGSQAASQPAPGLRP